MNEEKITRNAIVSLSLEFSVEILKFCDKLFVHKKYTVYRQLGRAGTSIGANVFEAQNAESRSDFIHKMKVAAKEAEETQYWLILCRRAFNYNEVLGIENKLVQIQSILASIISTTKKKT